MPDLEKFSTCQGSATGNWCPTDSWVRTGGGLRWPMGLDRLLGSGKGPEKGELSPGRKEAAG